VWLCGEKEGELKYVEGVEMNEKWNFKTVIARDLVFRSEYMFVGLSAPRLNFQATNVPNTF
jgi:hypothetical protein